MRRLLKPCFWKEAGFYVIEYAENMTLDQETAYADYQLTLGCNVVTSWGETSILDSMIKNIKEMMDMFKKVIVPLDGSTLAENTLPFVKNLAKEGCVEEVVLLNVVEIPIMWVSENFDIFPLKNAQFRRAQKYLTDIETQLSSEGINVKSEILEGAAAKCIVEYAQNNSADLIVIGTHGYTGMKEVVFGSVALKVLHDSNVPVLLIKWESHTAWVKWNTRKDKYDGWTLNEG